MTTAYIGFGSNLEDPQQQVTTACRELAAISGVQLVKASSLYRSSPMGPADQPYFINAVAEIATSLNALSLLAALQKIENDHGRLRDAIRWGPRTLDLDILLYGEEVINTGQLTIPHPGLYERPFVLYPLQEIAPELVIPGSGPLFQWVRSCEQGELKVIGRIEFTSE